MTRFAIKLLTVLVAVSALGSVALAQVAPPAIETTEPDRSVVVPSFKLPPSIYLSPEARAKLPRQPTPAVEPMTQALIAGKGAELRAASVRAMAPAIARAAERFGVAMTATRIAGLPAVRVTPIGSIPPANRRKILLDLPGGFFVVGSAEGTGMQESIPLAALARVEVVSITYRQAPEFMFPAASDDVVAVYRELLKTHRPQDIAIFGGSAGGLLTAEAIARFERDKLPLPAAIGIFSASADARWEGDSRTFAYPFQGRTGLEPRRPYFREADLTDPLASPILAPELLRHFPPTLLITATRAKDLSAAVETHRQLVKAGVEAELHVWDGLGHAFYYDASLPESREAFEVQAAFFRKHLGLK